MLRQQGKCFGFGTCLRRVMYASGQNEQAKYAFFRGGSEMVKNNSERSTSNSRPMQCKVKLKDDGLDGI